MRKTSRGGRSASWSNAANWRSSVEIGGTCHRWTNVCHEAEEPPRPVVVDHVGALLGGGDGHGHFPSSNQHRGVSSSKSSTAILIKPGMAASSPRATAALTIRKLT